MRIAIQAEDLELLRKYYMQYFDINCNDRYEVEITE